MTKLYVALPVVYSKQTKHGDVPMVFLPLDAKYWDDLDNGYIDTCKMHFDA